MLAPLPLSPVEDNLYEPSRGTRLHLFAIKNELCVESGGVRQRLEAQQTTQSRKQQCALPSHSSVLLLALAPSATRNS